MDKTTETWITVPKRPVSTSNRQACLVHISPTGAGMGSRYMLGDTPVVLGRDHDCDLAISDQSVLKLNDMPILAAWNISVQICSAEYQLIAVGR